MSRLLVVSRNALALGKRFGQPRLGLPIALLGFGLQSSHVDNRRWWRGNNRTFRRRSEEEDAGGNQNAGCRDARDKDDSFHIGFVFIIAARPRAQEPLCSGSLANH